MTRFRAGAWCSSLTRLDTRRPSAGAWTTSGPGVGNWWRRWSSRIPRTWGGHYTHKPFIVMDAHHPNRAARINGFYKLVTVSRRGGQKIIPCAHAEHLGGPWIVEKGIRIDTGTGTDFDARHTDAVSGFYFPERDETLYFYMGDPLSRRTARSVRTASLRRWRRSADGNPWCGNSAWSRRPVSRQGTGVPGISADCRSCRGEAPVDRHPPPRNHLVLGRH